MTEALWEDRLERRDYLILATFCLILFGLSLFGGRPLSIHESVLPQSSRSMLADGDYVVPKKGDAPWLESPPFPQWATVSIASVIGRCDEVWIVRSGPTLAAMATVLLIAWMASAWFGRQIGLLSGYVFATTCQFTRYAWLAEDEIFLCMIVTASLALFTKIELSFKSSSREVPQPFFGNRNWLMLAFFVVLGMTNLCKGLAFGTAMAVIPIAGFLLWNADKQQITRYFWFWGWLAFLGIAISWPLAALVRYPDVVDLWRYDLQGRLTEGYIGEPIWYYAQNLPWILAPWTLVIPFGFWVTRYEALAERYSPQRFLWCWALLVPAVFSLPDGKHHHYMLHAIAPWSILASFGLLFVREKMMEWPRAMRHPAISLLTVATPGIATLWMLRDRLPGPEWLPIVGCIALPIVAMTLTWLLLNKSLLVAGRGLFVATAMFYAIGHVMAGQYFDISRHDANFLTEVNSLVDSDDSLLVDMSVSDLRGFHCLFYLRDDVETLHNLSFLRDERIEEKTVYVLTRFSHESTLNEFGKCEVVLRSEETGREKSIGDRMTLFRLNYNDDVKRISSANVRISPMQSMYRSEGPFLGKRL
ncbi:MAG: hypothetical protein CMJ78_16065 [Planctomycetaceae bacterium]|nr:hypothetical protein [Planctomycetaceae bacterium]